MLCPTHLHMAEMGLTDVYLKWSNGSMNSDGARAFGLVRKHEPNSLAPPHV